MTEQLDSVARYAMAVGFAVRPRTVLVEGTTDVDLFQLAARLECKETGDDLLGSELAIVAAGERDRGGARGVIRELVCLRGIGRTCLLPNGSPRYRFIGLFDNDTAGQLAVQGARNIDSSILEFKDVFRLWPVMPMAGNLDPGTLQKTFERENAPFKGLQWELEDLLPSDFIDAVASECRSAVRHSTSIGGKFHRDLSPDGKARLHRLVKLNAVRADLNEVINILKAIRCYVGLKGPAQIHQPNSAHS